MAAAVIAGTGHETLLCCGDRTRLVVEGMLVERASEMRHQLDEWRINEMANAIAKRFSNA